MAVTADGAAAGGKPVLSRLRTHCETEAELASVLRKLTRAILDTFLVPRFHAQWITQNMRGATTTLRRPSHRQRTSALARVRASQCDPSQGCGQRCLQRQKRHQKPRRHDWEVAGSLKPVRRAAFDSKQTNQVGSVTWPPPQLPCDLADAGSPKTRSNAHVNAMA